MGQIIIDIPNPLNRRYEIDNDRLPELVEFLEELTSEDRKDIQAAREARSEESIAWEEAKIILGV